MGSFRFERAVRVGGRVEAARAPGTLHLIVSLSSSSLGCESHVKGYEVHAGGEGGEGGAPAVLAVL
jgi:hypothetical protein